MDICIKINEGVFLSFYINKLLAPLYCFTWYLIEEEQSWKWFDWLSFFIVGLAKFVQSNI